VRHVSVAALCGGSQDREDVVIQWRKKYKYLKIGYIDYFNLIVFKLASFLQ